MISPPGRGTEPVRLLPTIGALAVAAAVSAAYGGLTGGPGLEWWLDSRLIPLLLPAGGLAFGPVGGVRLMKRLNRRELAPPDDSEGLPRSLEPVTRVDPPVRRLPRPPEMRLSGAYRQRLVGWEGGSEMGIGVKVSCPCFGSFPLQVGARNAPPRNCLFPFLCTTCGVVSCLDIYAPALVCAHCNAASVVPYGSPAAVGQRGSAVVFGCSPTERFTADELTLTDGTYWCPTCRKHTARFSDAGIQWD